MGEIAIKVHNPQCASIVPIVVDDQFCDCGAVVELIDHDDPRADIAKMVGKKDKEK